jgi:hypothetical protein
MREVVKIVWRFIFLIFIQVFILNQIEIGWGIHFMAYPLMIMLLPFEMNVVYLIIIAFFSGFTIDLFSNTFGLHASSLMVFAYFRPILFKFYAPREGYDPLKEPSLFDMGGRWFIFVYGYLLLIHHFWFFFIEIFRISDFFFILQKTLLSLVVSYLLAVLLQTFFIRSSKSK